MCVCDIVGNERKKKKKKDGTIRSKTRELTEILRESAADFFLRELTPLANARALAGRDGGARCGEVEEEGELVREQRRSSRGARPYPHLASDVCWAGPLAWAWSGHRCKIIPFLFFSFTFFFI